MTESQLHAGQVFSHYRIVEKLGDRGLGLVYESKTHVFHRPVALKSPPLLSHDAISIRRLRRETETASAMNHPNNCTTSTKRMVKGS